MASLPLTSRDVARASVQAWFAHSVERLARVPTVEYLHRVRRTFVAPLRLSQVEILEVGIVEFIDVDRSCLLGLDCIRK